MVSCAANGQTVATSAWTSAFGGWPTGHEGRPSPLGDRCADDLGFGIDVGGVELTGPLTAAWTFTAPGDTRISSLDERGVGAHKNMPKSQQSFPYVLRTGDAQILEASPPQGAWFLGSPSGTRGFEALNTQSLTFEMTCPAEVRCGGLPAAVSVLEARVALRDIAAPEAAPWTGRLGGTVRADFSDKGGGVRTASLLVDGRVVETVQFCREPFAERVPCPLSGTAEFATPADGAQLAIALVDAAGNRTVSGAVPAPTAQATPPAAAEPGGTPPTRGVVALVGRRTVRARYGKPALIRGTLKTPEGAAIGAARVAVTGTAGVMTDAQGRFSARLPKGPSRTVRFAYGDSAQTVKLIVAAPVRLKVSPTKTPNGRSVKFNGSVPQAGRARTRVELQAWANGNWVPFKTVALRNERFRAGYRFMRTFSAQRYRFRAVIQDDPNFVYAAGRSKEVRVRVRP